MILDKLKKELFEILEKLGEDIPQIERMKLSSRAKEILSELLP